MDINRAASTEILANLLTDLEAFSRSAAAPGQTDYTVYQLVLGRIADLADLTGATFGDVLDEQKRIADELQADRDNRQEALSPGMTRVLLDPMAGTQEWADAKAADDAKGLDR